MEDVIARMQDEKNGIPIRTVKSFLSKIPSVFSGSDIVQWLIKNLTIEDPGIHKIYSFNTFQVCISITAAVNHRRSLKEHQDSLTFHSIPLMLPCSVSPRVLLKTNSLLLLDLGTVTKSSKTK
ncbi:hypothetical protein STEG23_021552, partial [Scotinomys teguina]